MKPDKHSLAAASILSAAVCLILLAWIGSSRAIDTQRRENLARVTATLADQAATFAEQIDRQILAIDQTLLILSTAREADPRQFDLKAWRNQTVALNGLSVDMVLTDEKGIIRQSSVRAAVNQNASGLDYFRALASRTDRDDQIYIGPASIDPIMRQRHIDVARSLHRADGSFAGVVDADFRIAAISDVFGETHPGADAFVALIGLDDGKLRASMGLTTIDPGAGFANTPMFAAIRKTDSGIWTGSSAQDGVRRVHAFRRLRGRDLAVVVGMSEAEAMRPVAAWREQARIFAGCLTALFAGLALLLIRVTRLSRQREALMAADRAGLTASNAQLEAARALAAAKAEQLEALLAGMSDGVSMVDAQLRLVEWNAQFPDIAGVPAELLRFGTPMADILHAQINTGQFGSIDDPQAEVDRRLARLRVAPFGVTQRQRPDGHTLELRRDRLPDGGFVTLYTDITKHKQAEAALRQAKAAAEIANAEKSSFVAIVSHEIRTPLNALLNTIRLLSDSLLAPAQQSLLATARGSGDALVGLINDILDMSQMEAGKLTIRPSLFELRPLLETSAEMFASQAAERGIVIRISIDPATPPTLFTDPGRLRQVQLNLLSNAVKYGRPGDVWLTAEPGRGAQEAVLLRVKDDGPVISPQARARLFRPFSRLDRPEGDSPAGTGLGLSICHHLITLMGGTIGCEPWDDNGPEGAEGRGGNAFWVMLPPTALPSAGLPRASGWADQAVDELAAPPAEPGDRFGRLPPRTRVLLTDDIVANQLVTATLLRGAGHQVDVVSSGPAAIEAVQARPYDLVFMDSFMPGMSGQDATRIIRTLPEPGCSVPIIALTGNVTAEDEALFRAAGMDGVLGKPVSLKELLRALNRYVWSTCVSTAKSGAPASGSDRPRPLEPVPVLADERIHELRTNLPPETFAILIEECLVDLDHRLPALRRGLLARAPAAVLAHVHAMVGMAAGYGMAALEARLRMIMAAARDGDLTAFGSADVMALEADIAEAARSLREILREEVV